MFGRKRSRQHITTQLQTLAEQVQSLAEKLDHVRSERPGVTIEHMQIDQAYLDELIFRLDSLDIQELSGSLNLGNNFHPKVSHTSVKRPEPVPLSVQPKEPASQDAPPADGADSLAFDDGRHLNTTKRGFLVTLS